jgi:hypothetical protein
MGRRHASVSLVREASRARVASASASAPWTGGWSSAPDCRPRSPGLSEEADGSVMPCWSSAARERSRASARADPSLPECRVLREVRRPDPGPRPRANDAGSAPLSSGRRPHRRRRLTVLDRSRFGLAGAGSRRARDCVRAVTDTVKTTRTDPRPAGDRAYILRGTRCEYRSARRRIGHAPNERITVPTWLWIVIIVIVVLAVLGYFGRGRLSR